MHGFRNTGHTEDIRAVFEKKRWSANGGRELRRKASETPKRRITNVAADDNFTDREEHIAAASIQCASQISLQRDNIL